MSNQWDKAVAIQQQMIELINTDSEENKAKLVELRVQLDELLKKQKEENEQ